jgi:hypothetical protein
MKLWSTRWAGYVACTGKKRNAYRDFIGNPERKRALGKSRRKWEYKSV